MIKRYRMYIYDNDEVVSENGFETDEQRQRFIDMYIEGKYEYETFESE